MKAFAAVLFALLLTSPVFGQSISSGYTDFFLVVRNQLESVESARTVISPGDSVNVRLGENYCSESFANLSGRNQYNRTVFFYCPPGHCSDIQVYSNAVTVKKNGLWFVSACGFESENRYLVSLAATPDEAQASCESFLKKSLILTQTRPDGFKCDGIERRGFEPSGVNGAFSLEGIFLLFFVSFAYFMSWIIAQPVLLVALLLILVWFFFIRKKR